MVKFHQVSRILCVDLVRRWLIHLIKMGVTGLHSYMCEEGLEPVIREKINFLEEIEMWQE